MDYLSQSYLLLPQEPGVYFFLDKKGKVLYVGKARNLKKRVSSYFTHKKDLLEKTRLLINNTSKIKITAVESEFDALLLEANFIKKYKPKFNIKLTDGKAYPLVRITIDDDYPKILISRRKEDKKSLYFGPFPNAGELKIALSFIRRIFSYQSVINHPKKPCFYYHLGLCPCPSVFNSKDAYKKNISHIVALFNGKKKTIIKKLEKERGILSKQEEFEQAKAVQKKILALQSISKPSRKPFEYEQNPNLRIDLRISELSSLSKILNISLPAKIECFDISNISGKFATGSMVVFINGEKESSLYRRFKIKNEEKPNDFAMMQEVLFRRLKHTEWKLPDLIIIDGGKGQISSVLKILKDSHL
ncbi:MAG: GIY-YIG nuclease family protein, partial [bacterium]|nr:GIY-YIG nuclease family protein [bacterium]